MQKHGSQVELGLSLGQEDTESGVEIRKYIWDILQVKINITF